MADGYRKHGLHRHKMYGLKRFHITSYAQQIMLRRQLLQQAVLAGDEYSWFRFSKYRNKFFARLLRDKKSINCEYCGKKNLDPFTEYKNKLATLDHRVPISRGGKVFEVSNLAIACHFCNNKKGTLLPEEFKKAA